MILVLSIAGAVLAAIPAGLFLSNLPRFALTISDQVPPDEGERSVSVLIPARDEQDSIAASVNAARSSTGVDVEVIVLDDDSHDETAQIVQQIQAQDSRVRLLKGSPLPAGWNGKQHACAQLADAARFSRIVFIDADVRLQPNALDRLLRQQDSSGVALLSAFPHQQTETWLEKWIIPLMHFILLGFLPLDRMRASTQPAYAAGCGQLFLTGIEEYRQAGTHAAIRGSRHDGLMLPRAYRTAGLMTDVVDGTSLAECRMYHSAPEVIRGILKNATEGIANPRLIVPFTILLVGGSILPIITLIAALTHPWPLAIVISLVGIVLGHLPRLVAASRFRQSPAGVIFHALSVGVFVLLQWIALWNRVRGHRVAWRGRTES